MALGLARGLGRLAYWIDARGRQTALENLRVIFGDRFDEKERRAIALESFQNFARNAVDLFWAGHLTRDNYEQFVEIQTDHMDAVEEGRETGAIWVTPHYGNFEWIAYMMGFRDFPFMIIAQDFKNPHLTQVIKECREGSGHEVIGQRRAMIKLLKHLKGRGQAAFLTDLTVKPSRAATIIRCFGRQTCVTLLHAVLAERSGLRVIPGMCFPQADGTYRIEGFAPLEFSEGESLQQIAQSCWDVFEAKILENPGPWIWMYKHWRYLPAEADPATYPAYANRSARFDALEKQIAES